MMFFNISSQGDFSTITDDFSIEIAGFFLEAQVWNAWVIIRTTNQRITKDEPVKIDCVEIWFDELNWYYLSHTPSVAVPRGHHTHIADLGNLSYYT